MKTAVRNKILSVIEKYAMLENCDTVIAAVSGGADSMCLLHFFNIFSSKNNIKLICAHVNHGIRGAEADRDEKFVRDFCEKNGISFKAAHYDVPAISKQTGESEEQCGRRLRYAFFSSLCEKCENARIATAHHLNDSIETAVFNLARGTGLKGLTGISPVRGNIIRPLIECTRDEIECYLKENNIDYIIDSTNLSDDYSRNAIRHNVIPELKKINPAFESVFLSCSEVLSDTERFLEKITQEAFNKINKNMKFSVSEIVSFDSIIRNRLLMKIAGYFGANDVTFSHISLMNDMLKNGGAVNLHGNVTICSDGKYIYKRTEPENTSFISVPFEEGKTCYDLGIFKVTAEPIDKKELNIYNDRYGFCDADKIKNAVFRRRTEGDRFKFPNAEHSKSLKNLFKEKGLTPEQRFSVPMLADDNNILWIYGIGASEYAKVTGETKRIIRIRTD